MSKIALKDGTIVPATKLESYFRKLFKAEESGEEFPVDLDDVTNFAYSDRAEFIETLGISKFREGIDYRVISMPADKLGDGLERGLPCQKYFLTIQCMEYMAAREVDAVFEVLHRSRIKFSKKTREKPRPSERARELVASGKYDPRDEIKKVTISCRRIACDALGIHGIRDPRDFAIVTEAVHYEILGCSTRAFKAAMNLPTGSSTRVHMSIPQRWICGATEAVLPDLLSKHSAQGVGECAEIARSMAKSLRLALQAHGVDTRSFPKKDVA